MRRVRGIIPKEKQLTKDMLRVIARVSHIKETDLLQSKFPDIMNL